MGLLFGTRRILVGSATSWTPEDPLPNSALLPEHWYRSDQGLWQDAGLTVATADGDVVGRWEDITANADHINQAAAGNKPTLQNGAGDLLNNHPVVRFDGIDDYLQGTFTTGGVMAQPNTVFMVAALDVAQVNDDGTHYLVCGSAGLTIVLYQRPNDIPDKWAIFAGAVLQGGASDANWNLWTILFNGVTSQFWQNGVSEGGPADAGAGNPAGITIGASNAGILRAKIDTAEIILYDANLSNANKNDVGHYLAARYGLAYTDI